MSFLWFWVRLTQLLMPFLCQNGAAGLASLPGGLEPEVTVPWTHWGWGPCSAARD